MVKAKEEPRVIFRFPSYSTEFKSAQQEINFDERMMEYKHSSPIIKIIHNTNNSSIIEILSLEEFGKVIQWNVLERTKEEADRNFIDFGRHSKIGVFSPQFIDLSKFLSLHPEALCFDLDVDSNNM